MAELDYDYLAALVKKARKGDSDAFAELYAATYTKQYNYSYQYVKDPYLAQDIIQEVYILVLKKLSTLKNPRLFVSWLNQITFHVCYNYKLKMFKQKQELSEYDNLSNITPASSSSPEKKLELKYEKTELMAGILNLKPKEAQVIIMKYYNNMTLVEIADAMDCSRSTVKRYLNSGKNSLKRLMPKEDWGGVLSENE